VEFFKKRWTVVNVWWMDLFASLDGNYLSMAIRHVEHRPLDPNSISHLPAGIPKHPLYTSSNTR
jgi:hypothetical protein